MHTSISGLKRLVFGFSVSKKVNYMKFVQRFVADEIEIKIVKGQWSFRQSSNSHWSDFNYPDCHTGIEQVSLVHLRCLIFGQTGVKVQWLQTMGPDMGIDLWPLTRTPPDPLLCKALLFIKNLDRPIYLSPFLLKSDQLEKLAPYKRSLTFLRFCPLFQKRNWMNFM